MVNTAERTRNNQAPAPAPTTPPAAPVDPYAGFTLTDATELPSGSALASSAGYEKEIAILLKIKESGKVGKLPIPSDLVRAFSAKMRAAAYRLDGQAECRYAEAEKVVYVKFKPGRVERKPRQKAS